MEAMDRCIQEYGGVGLILAIGSAEYDDEKRTFQNWHEQLKGGKSKYEYERIKRGATSRVRKITFVLRKTEVLWLTSDLILAGIRGNWIGKFQEGMRNADGSPRRPKYEINVEAIPDNVRIL
jgi:hypothetical protein